MILVDTGPLVALTVPTDRNHAACLALHRVRRGEFLVPATVVAETSYLIEQRLGGGAEETLLRLLASGGLLSVDVHSGDYGRMADLVRRYRDMPLGATDASIVALAERLGVTEIATLDHRHFRVVRPRHVDAFTLLPADPAVPVGEVRRLRH